MDLEDQVDRGRAAALFLGNPLLVDAFVQLEQSYTNRWKTAGTTEEREECHRMITALVQLKRAIEYVVGTGKRAEDTIKYQENIGRKVPNV